VWIASAGYQSELLTPSQSIAPGILSSTNAKSSAHISGFAATTESGPSRDRALAARYSAIEASFTNGGQRPIRSTCAVARSAEVAALRLVVPNGRIESAWLNGRAH